MRLLLLLLLVSFSLMAQVNRTHSEDLNQPSRITQIRDRMRTEKTNHQKLENTCRKHQNDLLNIAYLEGSDTKIKAYLSLKEEIAKTVNELKSESERQIELVSFIDSIKAQGNLIPQAASYLEEAREELRSIGVQQQALDKQLTDLYPQINMAIRSQPPPDTFTNASGMTMKLIGSGAKAFYISIDPMALEGDVTYQAALQQASRLSNRENAKYTLLSAKEIELLRKTNLTPEYPTWTQMVWEGNSQNEAHTLERFGMVMQTIWDPKLQLGHTQLFGEVPQAHYPQLKAYVVTSKTTGWQFRWRNLAKQQVDKQ